MGRDTTILVLLLAGVAGFAAWQILTRRPTGRMTGTSQTAMESAASLPARIVFPAGTDFSRFGATTFTTSRPQLERVVTEPATGQQARVATPFRFNVPLDHSGPGGLLDFGIFGGRTFKV